MAVCCHLIRTSYLTFLSVTRNPRCKLLFLLYVAALIVGKTFLLDTAKTLYTNHFCMSSEYTKQAGRELIQLQLVFKHGHRSPFRIYKTDPNPPEIWPEGLSALTKLGRLQMYTLGDHMRQRYKDFVTSNPNEVFALSSEASRCLYSAYSFLAGMYPPDEEWSFGQGIPWQPIQVTYLSDKENKFLQSSTNCPRYEQSKHFLIDPHEAKQDDEAKFYFNFWQKHSNITIKTTDNAADLYKTLVIERDFNLTVPDWAWVYWDRMVALTDYSYFTHFQSRLQQRLRAGPLLNLFLQRMKERIDEENKDIKVYIYAGHGSNIAAIQCALQMYDMKHAPLGTTIAVELYKENAGGNTVRFLLFNSSHPEIKVEDPYIFQLHGCTEYCPVRFYEDFIQDLVPEDWEKECEVETGEYPEEIIPIQYAEFVTPEKSGKSTSSSMAVEKLHIYFLSLSILFIYANFYNYLING